MRLRVIVPVLLLVLMLAAACAAPTGEQLQDYARYAALRATEAAASQTIASSKATEAAAASQLAQLTAEAARPTATPTPEATAVPDETLLAAETLTATLTMTATTELTATAAAEAPLTPTEALATPALPAEVSPTPTGTATATPTEALATVTPTSTPSPTPTPTATATVTDTPTPVPTATDTPTPTDTATPTSTPTATFSPMPAPTTTPTPSFTSSPTPAQEAGIPWLAWGLVLDEASQGATPIPTPTPVAAGTAVVTSQQANVRGGPGVLFDVAATARQGDELSVTGRDEAGNWWQVCCVDGRSGWVSNSIVRFQGEREAVPVVGPLMPDDLEATWAVRWECHGAGCDQEQCLGQSQASTLQVRDLRWLEVTRQSTWDGGCGVDEDWVTQVDRYTGRESQSSAGAPLFYVWEGSNPGPANRSVDLVDRRLALWCTDTRTQEQEQGDGWTVVYEGQACYDVTSGILALMQYTKRWLFSGTFEGQTFDRQYFGDYELYQQVLTDTNVPLSGVSLSAGPG